MFEIIKDIGFFVVIVALFFLEIVLFTAFFECWNLYSKIGKKISSSWAILSLLFINSSLLLFLLFPYYSDYIYSAFFNISNGNIMRAFVVISLLSIHVYFIFVILFSTSFWEYGTKGFGREKKVFTNGYRNVILFRLILLSLSIWFLFAARDLTTLLYLNQEIELVNLFDMCSDILYAMYDNMLFNFTHLLLSFLLAIILLFFSINIVNDKPFLKIVRFWNWLHLRN